MCLCVGSLLVKPEPVVNGRSPFSLDDQKHDHPPQPVSLRELSVSKKRCHPVAFSPELVLKVRIQNPNTRENDFIEVELDRQELTYRSLLRVCCRELDISTEHVEKIRKLPNTMLRKVC